MSYSCGQHGWMHALKPCPNCTNIMTGANASESYIPQSQFNGQTFSLLTNEALQREMLEILKRIEAKIETGYPPAGDK